MTAVGAGDLIAYEDALFGLTYAEVLEGPDQHGRLKARIVNRSVREGPYVWVPTTSVTGLWVRRRARAGRPGKSASPAVAGPAR